MSAPRFNHVAMSVPSSLLDDASRADILRFHDEVFGWKEMPTMTEPGRRLVLQAYSWDQFVFLISEDDPMRCPRLDHFGMSVSSREQFDDFHARARAFSEKDDRVDLIDHDVERFGDFLELHNFYVRFLLPMMVEVQYYDWAEGISPDQGAA
jgi:hypothetical protein